MSQAHNISAGFDFENSFTNMDISVVKKWSKSIYLNPDRLLQSILNCASLNVVWFFQPFLAADFHFWSWFFHIDGTVFGEMRLNSVHIWLQCTIFSP